MRKVKEKMAEKMAGRYGTRMILPVGIIVLILISIVDYLIYYVFLPSDKSLQNVIIFFIGVVLVEVVLLSILPFSWRFFDVPEEIYLENVEDIKEKQEKIDKLIEKGKSLTPQKVAFDMGVIIQEFERNFMGITSNSSSQEINELFAFSGNNLDKLIDEWLPKAKLVLKNADEVEKNIYSINAIRNQYGNSFSELFRLKEKLEEFIKEKGSGFTPEEIRKPLIRVFGILWGVDEECCNVKMQLAINTCLSSLRQNMSVFQI